MGLKRRMKVAFCVKGILFFALLGPVFSAEPEMGTEPSMSWEYPAEHPPQEDEYSDLGVKQNRLPAAEDQEMDPRSVPGAAVNQGRSLKADEETLLKKEGGKTEKLKSKPDALEQAWQKKGYSRPVGPGEKEGASESAIRDSGVQKEIRQIRDGSY